MKARLGWVFAMSCSLCVGSVGCQLPGGVGGTGGGGGSMNVGPAVTPVGTPTGAALTAKVGAMGGTLRTADGKLELIVPAGALAGDVDLKLTPISTEAPLSVGPSVRLEPEGTTFAVPAKLVLHYESFASATSPDLLLAATQDSSGKWLPQGTPVVDTTAKTVSVDISHFSDWSFAACAKLDIDNYVASPPDTDIHLTLAQQCDDPMAQTAPLGPVNPTTATVDWRKQDARGQPGPGILTPMGATATVKAEGTPSDPRVEVSATWQSPRGMRVFRDTVAVGTTLDFTVDGMSIIVPTSSSVLTMMGKSNVNGAVDMSSVSVNFAGSGEGGFASNPTAGLVVSATMGNANYFDTYTEPCTTTEKTLVNQISVSHANRERQFIVGSFSGTLGVHRGTVMCNGSPVPNVVVVPFSGAFITRWLVY